MKKFFLFAAVAGMLASCSSESLTGSDPNIEPTPQEDLVPIEIGVASGQTKGMTRGTGTAGGTDDTNATLTTDDDNIWRGEKIKVLMYKINQDGTPSFNFATDGATPTPSNLYDATMSLVTPLKTENTKRGIAKQINSGDPYSPSPLTATGQATYKVKYYPSSGRFDFWGFYLGGNAASPSADTSPTVTLTDFTATCDDNTTTTPAKAVAFTIDGTQDLMVAKAATGASDATSSANIVGNVPFTAGQEAEVGTATSAIYASSYSAKSARGGLQPDLVFKHTLSRLKFQVQAGTANAVGVQVKAIKVHSMTNGKLIVAYDYTNGNISAANSIVWDNTKYNPATDFTTDADGDGLYNYQDPDVYPALALQERSGDAMQALTAYTLVAADVTKPKEIGEALLVAPQQKYWIEVEYDATATPAKDWFDDSDSGTPASTNPTPITADIVRTSLTGGTGSAPKAFAAGESYLVTITLYGPEEIKITTSLIPWTTSDQDIEVNAD